MRLGQSAVVAIRRSADGYEWFSPAEIGHSAGEARAKAFAADGEVGISWRAANPVVETVEVVILRKC